VFYPVQYIIGNWFPDKKGSVLGLVLMSTGVAGMIFNPVAAGWIEKFGWQWSYKAQAIIILAVALPAALFLLYKSPEEAGFASAQADAGLKKVLQPEEVQQRTSRFTVIKLFVMVFMICGSYGIVQHLPKYASDLGKNATFGALLVSMAMAGNLTGKAFFGAANDKFGAKAMTMFSALCVCLGITVVIFCKVNALLMVGSFLMGIVLVMISLQVPLLFRGFCDSVTYEKVYPLTCSANVALCAVSQNFVSVQYQQAGGYEKVFAFYGVVMIGLCLILLTIGRKKKV
jgi:MFS family permease